MSYDYERQIDRFVAIMKGGEKSSRDFKLGVEMEHFVVREDYTSIPYLGDDGVEGIMARLIEKGWKPHSEIGHVLTVTKDDLTVTTEPGAQLEFSMLPKRTLKEMEEAYKRFQADLLPILEAKGYKAIAMAYHPKTKIRDIELLPKKRYHNMFSYFKTHGSRSHNMMKGTSSLQISIDYSDEMDYRKKFYVANMLSNVFYATFENGFYFEGGPCDMHNIRAYIWQNTDHDRSGLVEGALDSDFTYEKYARYLLDRPAIFAYVDGELTFTQDTLIRDLVDPDTATNEELEHLMTMFFSDVRTKNFIEIRMMDAIPYPLNLAAVALIKGLFYDDKNLEELYHSCQNLDRDRVMEARQALYARGFYAEQCDDNILTVAKRLVAMAKDGLNAEERAYLEPLETMLNAGMTPYAITRQKYETEGFGPSVDWTALGGGGIGCQEG